MIPELRLEAQIGVRETKEKGVGQTASLKRQGECAATGCVPEIGGHCAAQTQDAQGAGRERTDPLEASGRSTIEYYSCCTDEQDQSKSEKTKAQLQKDLVYYSKEYKFYPEMVSGSPFFLESPL